MSKIIEKEILIQSSLKEFTKRCILVRDLTKQLTTDYFLLLSEKLNKNYPLAPSRKEELLLGFLDKIEFGDLEECKVAIEHY